MGEVRKGEDELGYAFQGPPGPFPTAAASGPDPLPSPPHRTPARSSSEPGTRRWPAGFIGLPIVSAAPPHPSRKPPTRPTWIWEPAA